MFLGIAKTDEIDGEPGPERVFLENDADEVAHNIENNPDIKYFNIKIAANQVATLQRITIKAGPRRESRAMDIVELVAGGVVVVEAEIQRD